MLFNSLSFLIFLPIVVIGYYLLPHRLRWAWLLVASCYFYASFVPAYLLILFALIGIDYLAALLMERERADGKRKLFLWIGIGASLAMLFVFKYFNFANENIAALAEALGWNYPVEALTLLLPLGLSFHIFQCISYLVDVYRKERPAEKHLGIFALFVMFFPQLVAGPIERAGHLLPQFTEKHTFSWKLIVSGVALCIVGFFLKLVVADRSALIVDAFYQDPSVFSGPAALLALFLFAFQLYGDFAGYTLIALGSARMLGFSLMENFRRPYLAKSIGEFWQRWHISLSTWLRDYVYQSVIRLHKRVSVRALYTAVIVTFLASGVWHGAGWNFILMGLFFGIVIVIELATKKWREALGRILGPLSPYLATLTTFALVLIGWMLFRSPSIGTIGDILLSLASGWDTFLTGAGSASYWKDAFAFGYEPREILITLGAIAGLMGTEVALEKSDTLKNRLDASLFLRVFVYTFLVLAILAFGEFNEKVFIYFQF